MRLRRTQHLLSESPVPWEEPLYHWWGPNFTASEDGWTNGKKCHESHIRTISEEILSGDITYVKKKWRNFSKRGFMNSLKKKS